MTAVLIDDEPLARSVVKEYLQNFSDIQVVDECNNGFEGVKSIQQHQPDVVFLDIQMPKINGFEMLELIEDPPAVVFTTAYDEYAIKAFEKHAVDYLLKPFSLERFTQAIEKLSDVHARENQKKITEALINNETAHHAIDRIVVKHGGSIRIIPLQQIQYLEAADDYVKIHTADGSFLKNKTMSFYEQSLSADQFVRIHRSYILNVQEITRMEPYQKENHLAILRSGAQVPVSKAGYAKLKSLLGI